MTWVICCITPNSTVAKVTFGNSQTIGLPQHLKNMCGVSVTSRLGCLSVPGEAHTPLNRMEIEAPFDRWALPPVEEFRLHPR